MSMDENEAVWAEYFPEDAVETTEAETEVDHDPLSDYCPCGCGLGISEIFSRAEVTVGLCDEEPIKAESPEPVYTYRLTLKGNRFANFHHMALLKDGREIQSDLFSWKWTAKKAVKRWMKADKKRDKKPSIIEGTL